MSDSDQRIREMVRSAVEEDPAIKNQVLLDRAKQIDADAVEGLTLRQFHARFRLPVARILSAGSSQPKPRKRAPRARRRPDPVPDRVNRDAVRDVFRRFAVQLAHAESRAEIVRAVARIDEFVEDVVRALGPGEDGSTARAARPSRRVVRATAGEDGGRRAEAAPQAGIPAKPEPGTSPRAPSSATAVPGPTPATAQAGESGVRDMARRRRPKGLKGPAASDAAPSAETSSSQTDAAPSQPELPAEESSRPPESAGFSLSHDLEEFRRRRADRERSRPAR